MAEQEGITADNWFDNFVEYVKQALEIVQLKGDAIDRASQDEEAFAMGLIVIALAGAGLAIAFVNPFGLIAFPVLWIVIAFIWAGVFHLLATLAFKGEGEFMDFFRPYALAFVLFWVNVVPGLNVVLGWAAGLWLLVVAALCVERVYGLDRPRAIATVGIPTAAVLALVFVFGVFVAAVWTFFQLSR